MTTATVKLVLRRHKRKADGTAPVWLRITANRKSRYISTGIYLEPRHWNETKQRVRAAHPIAPALNARLQDLLLQASRQALDTPSADAVKTSLNGAGGSLTSYFEGSSTTWTRRDASGTGRNTASHSASSPAVSGRR